MSFFDSLHLHADSTCLIDEVAGEFSYQAVSDLCDEVSSAMSPDKKLVLIICENRYESVIGYLSTLRSGCVAMLVNASLSRELLDEVIRLYQPHFIWKSVDMESAQPIRTIGGYGLYALGEGSDTELNPDLFLLLSTSGSTGSPKFTRLTEKNVSSNAASIAEYLELDETDRPVTTLPMAYSYGLSVINSHLHVGASILLTDSSLVTRSFWRFLREQKATSMAGVPYTYQMLQSLRFARMDLPSLRKMTQAGGKLPAELAEDFARVTSDKNIQFFIMYGQTEATARISYVPAESVQQKYLSIGKAIPQGKLFISSDDKTQVDEPGVEGELVYEGPNVMMGYAESAADLSKGDELSGRLHTGDLGKFDDDGFVYVTGRIKRIIKMFGNRINLDQLDQFISSHGFTGVSGGEDDHLKIALSGEQDIVAAKKKVIDAFKFDHKAVEVFMIDEIPRSESGKILYGQLFKAG